MPNELGSTNSRDVINTMWTATSNSPVSPLSITPGGSNSIVSVTNINTALTINLASGGTLGHTLTLILGNDATLGRVVTLGTNVLATASTIIGTISKKSVIEFVSDGTNWLEKSRSLLL